MAGSHAKVDEGCKGYLVEYSPFPHSEADGNAHLPVIVFPGKKLIAPSANSLDSTWVHPEYARSLPKLCAADLLGLEISGSGDHLDAVSLATEDLAVVWRLTDCQSLPYDLELLLAGPIPKCGFRITNFTAEKHKKKPLPLNVGSFRDLSSTMYSMRRDVKLITRPWEAYLGFRIPEINTGAWADPIWTELMDEQVDGACTAAWASLMICRAMERSPSTTLVQPQPFSFSRVEQTIMDMQSMHARMSAGKMLMEMGSAQRLYDLHGIRPSVAVGVHPEFNAENAKPNIAGDVWTDGHYWQTRNLPYPRMYTLMTCTAAVTLISVNTGAKKPSLVVRPGLVPACHVEPLHGFEPSDGSAYAKMFRTHRAKLERSVLRIGQASFQAENCLTVTSMESCGDELASKVVVSRDLIPDQPRLSSGADDHLRLHAKRLREFARLTLRLNVAPFVFVTVTVVNANKAAKLQPKQCGKRPMRPSYTYEMAMARGARGSGGGERGERSSGR